mgnify:CR=1 FL=1
MRNQLGVQLARPIESAIDFLIGALVFLADFTAAD